MLKKGLLIYFLFLLPVLAFSQNATEGEDVSQLFDKPKKIKWIQHYKGRIDDLNDVAVSLAYDGKNCKGILHYLRSKASFRLDGHLKKGVLTLKELDSSGKVSGHIQAMMLQGNILGEWTNYNHSFGGDLFLQQTIKPVVVPSYCGNNKWTRHYTGEFQGQPSDLILQKDGDNRLSGILYLSAKKSSYRLNGYLEENGLFNLQIQDDHRNSKGSLSGSLVEAHALNASYTTDKGHQGLAAYQIENELLVGCVEFADYISSYDITYPKLQHRQFNNWIDEVSETWIYRCRKYSEEVKKKNPKQKPELRASLRAYAWTDLDLLSDELISGFITFSNTWSSGMKGQSFNFDLKKGKEITFDDLFIPEFDYRRVVWNELNEKIGQHPLYREEGFRKWILNLEFPYFTIRREGISFCSDFDPVYGQQRVTISYDKLMPYLRKKSPVSPLLKHL